MIVLKNGRLIDGTGASPVDGAAIVIRDSRIAAVTTRSESDFPVDAEIIDVAGLTILPGLIDCHDHMANHRYDLAHRWRVDEPQSTRHLRTAAVLRNTLAAGYTTIRDAAGCDAGFKRAIEEGLIPGPRLVLSLSIISPIGGIGDAVSPSGLPLDDCCCIPGDPLLPNSVVNTLADVRPVVRRMVRAGADVIKCATTGRASSNAWPSAASSSCRRSSFTNTTANRRSRMSASAPRRCSSITSRASSRRSGSASRSSPAPMP